MPVQPLPLSGRLIRLGEEIQEWTGSLCFSSTPKRHRPWCHLHDTSNGRWESDRMDILPTLVANVHEGRVEPPVGRDRALRALMLNLHSMGKKAVDQQGRQCHGYLWAIPHDFGWLVSSICPCA